ncbi:MAG: alpha/beta hydrolase [Hyphomicrobiaceae bacterium]
MLNRLAGAILVLIGLLVPTVLHAQDNLVLLKRVAVDLSAGNITIDLSEAKGAFRALRVRAASGRITLTDVIVDYRDHARHAENRRINLLTGERTREINPTPEGHFPSSIRLEYVRIPRGKAVVEILGRQTAEDALRTWQPAPVAGGGAGGSRGKKKKAGRRSYTRSARPPDAAAPPPPVAKSAPETAAAPPEPKSVPDASAPPAMEPSPLPRAAAAPTPTPLACVTSNTCTPVRVFFGTNRSREDLPQRIAFSWQDSGELALGSAVVTVPRKVQRESGAILRPTWWDRYVLRVPPEGDPARHFVIVPGLFEVYSDEGSFLAAVARHRLQAGDYKDHAFVYVHGYRVDFDYGLYRTAQMAYDLGTARPDDGVIVPFGTAFLYSWPSAGALKDYAYDQESARLAVGHLKRFLELVIQKTGVKHVHLVAHSMGNVPLLNALSQMTGETTGGATVSQVILAAPDIGTREFRTLASQIKPVATGFTLYASSSDVAMEASRKVHKNEARAGDVVNGKPVVATGVDTIDISAITTCYFCFGHDEYVEQPELLNDIATLLQRGVRPPDTRTQAFRPQSEEGLEFWRYQP